MKKIILLPVWALLMFLAQTADAQVADTLSIRKAAIFKGNQPIKFAQAFSLMEPYPMALNEMRAAKSNRDASSVLSFVGGFLIGWSLGDIISGNRFNWGLAGAGGALVAVSIPLNSAYLKRANSAVNQYNQSLKGTSSVPTSTWKLGLSHASFGLSVQY